jgi:hypothetical protein
MMMQDYDTQKSKRIEELEELLETYKKENEELFAEVSKKEGTDMEDVLSKKRQRDETDTENHRIGELVRKNRQLQDGTYKSLIVGVAETLIRAFRGHPTAKHQHSHQKRGLISSNPPRVSRKYLHPHFTD